MKITRKRFGAGALAATFFAMTFAAAGSGAIAQDQAQGQTKDQAEPQTLGQVDTVIPESSSGSESAIRFVSNEVVQDVPEEPVEEAPQPSDAASLRELVSTIDTGGEMSREMMCLAQAIYFESRGEPLEGQLAVATVVVNRAESPRFPDDYCSVVTQRAQFSFVRGGRIPAPNRGSAAWERAKAVARIAHRDLWDSPADDALFFHATHVSPRWAGRMTARATINRHIFYR